MTRSEFDAEATQLDLDLGFDRGARLECPAKDCAHGGCPVQDTVERTWRHRDFFAASGVGARPPAAGALPLTRRAPGGCALGAPRGRGSRCCFQALVLSVATAMPIATLAAMTAEHDTRIWRVVEHHVNAARDQLDCSGVRRVGMDETSARKGQDYLSIVADLDARRVMFATEGRCAQTVGRCAADLAPPPAGATRPRSPTPAPR